MTSVLSSSPLSVNRVENLADRPVDFHHDVAEQAGAALAAELLRDVQRHVHHRVRHVEKERPRLVAVDEIDRVLGVLRRELGLVVAVDRGIDDFVVFDERQLGIALLLRFATCGDDISSGCRGHMSFEYGRPKYSSKPCCSGRNWLVVAQVPLAEDCGGVAAAAAQLGERGFLGVDAVLRLGAERAEDADALRDSSRSCSATRDAEQTAVAEWKSVKIRPSRAMRSRFGVLYAVAPNGPMSA